MTGSLIVEEVFSWNGLGSLFVEAIRSIDTPLIRGMYDVIWLAIFIEQWYDASRVNHWIDPRVREERR